MSNRENTDKKADFNMIEQDPLSLIFYFYPDDTPLRQSLLKHSDQVRNKALNI